MPKRTETKPDRIHCPACGAIVEHRVEHLTRHLEPKPLRVLVCTKCGTLRAASPKGDG